MHPIIKEYLSTTISLEEIIEKKYQKDNFFEKVFFEVVKMAVFKMEYNHAIYEKIDQAIVNGHPDENMYLLFINNAISFTWSQGEVEKTKSLLSIASSLSQEKIDPVIHAFYIQALALLEFSEKRINQGNQLAKEAINLVDKNHPRYRGLLTNYASNLAARGKLNDLDEEESKIFYSPPPKFKELMTAEVKVRNCIYTGNYNLGLKYAEEFQILIKDFKFNIQHFFDSLNFLSNDFDESHYQKESGKLLAQVFKHLSNGKIEESIKFYKLYLKNEFPIPNENLLIQFLPINFELCMGNSVTARKMLAEKKAKGDLSFLDDLYYGRVQLMENNIEGAYLSFKSLIKKVEHYGALPRVLFELQFAKELKPADLFLLMSNWKNVDLNRAPKVKLVVVANTPLQGIDLLIGNSDEISQIKSLVKKYAPLKEIVLISGETGTGKELVAQALHQEGVNSKEPFFAINCGALTDSLLESELFGYEAGSFTGALKQKKGIFEAAGKGTVFLDEFGDISSKLQVSLLRVLESNEIRMIGSSKNRKIECRIIVATNIELKQAVAEKKFREDLYFRLARLEISLQPLRERKKDIPALVDYFLEGSSGISGKKKLVSKDFLKAFDNYQWPGNIRELKNCVEKLKILNPEKDLLDVDDLSFIQFQGVISDPQNLMTSEKATTSHIEKTKINSGDDPILSLIHQSGLNPEQRILYLKELFQKYKILTRNQIMKITKVNPIAATKELQQLCNEGFIIRKCPSKSPRSVYFELK